MRRNSFILLLTALFCYLLFPTPTFATEFSVREQLNMDYGWRFALGHAWNSEKDFDHGVRDFSYYAKTGYGDGPANPKFDDRAWRILNLPHDWAVELPFDKNGTQNQGYRAIGRNFPENSIGWYRKTFFIPESDLGKRIVIEFDGVHRDSRVWINGFYIGEHHSGYTGFQYDLSDYLNYGSENVITVRADTTMEEGWYYEGAGIYRHVWLSKTAPVHVAQYGTFVTTTINKNQTATVTVKTKITNESQNNAIVKLLHTLNGQQDTPVAISNPETITLAAGETIESSQEIRVKKPALWSLENPFLYRLDTTIQSKNKTIDRYKTNFGMRSVRFDPDKGFFLNGKHLQIKGSNNHQDHAGVGAAVPDALQTFRLKRLKEMGSNAYRSAHNPPTPELLDAADQLGMLVLVENRLMGSSTEHLHELEQMILQNRNHPSIIAWSIGNEEWAIEGNETGARIAKTMQDFVQKLDPSRRVTAAMSGGWGQGISSVIDLMGFNYEYHGDIDGHHAAFPNQPSWLTEESTTRSTRGIYADNPDRAYLAPTDRKKDSTSIENGLRFCASRPFISGIFFWTGFDHRGEPNPYGWPQVTSQSGVIDLCGFPKDPFYYLQSWWTDKPVLYLSPHWNQEGKRDEEPIEVRAYSNADEVELFLNGNSLGRKSMPHLSHIKWEVPYKPGTLLAKAYKNGKDYIEKTLDTTDQAAVIRLLSDKTIINADGEDISVITVQLEDSSGRVVPTAENKITFKLEGPGKIIGVGNGNPSDHEPEQFLDSVSVIDIQKLKSSLILKDKVNTETNYRFDDSQWADFKQTSEVNKPAGDELIVIRGSFLLPVLTRDTKVSLFTASISEHQSVFINGKRIAKNIARGAKNQDYILDPNILKQGNNSFVAVGTPFVKTVWWEELNSYPGVVQVYKPHAAWQRRAFNGLAQVIVQADRQPGKIVVHAGSPGLKAATVVIDSLH
ncbi:MAG: DUF4982 domain-containing protein [Gammaproteobacteria bacterium]|nr:DUF4982 domain-containing protein [Gammaproteobacteria bacterium]